MTCEEFNESVALYVLAAASADEQRVMEAHLATHQAHQGCEAALAGALELAAKFSLAVPGVKPSAGVWAKIAEALPAAEANVVPLRAKPKTWMRSALPWGLALAAGIALVVLVRDRKSLREREQHFVDAARVTQSAELAAVAELDRTRSGLERATRELEGTETALEGARGALDRQSLAMELVSLPDTQVVSFAAAPGAAAKSGGVRIPTVRALYNPGRRQAVLVATGVTAVAGKDFELWLMRDKKPVAAGLLKLGAANLAVVVVDPKLLASGAFQAFALSLEPAGGSTEAPRGPVLLLGAVRG